MLLSACSEPAQRNEADLIVLCSTDVHALFLPDLKDGTLLHKSTMASASTYLNQVRQSNPDAVMLFDCGDMMQGNSLFYYYNYVNPRLPHIGARMANYLQYDALTMGNHDLEPGEVIYDDHLPDQLQMPLLCANAINSRTGECYFKPYTIIERQGFRIAVIGLLAPEAVLGTPKSSWPNIRFEAMSTAAQKWMKVIDETEKPDMTIGVLHAGFDPAISKQSGESVTDLVQKAPGFDLLLLGHDHLKQQLQLVDATGDTVTVLQPLPDALELGRANIHLKRENGKTNISITTDIVTMADFEPDQDFCKAFDEDLDHVNHYLDHALGSLAEPIDASLALTEQCDLTCLVHTVQLEMTDADISFASALSAFKTIEAGPITMHQLFDMYRYENELFKLWMQGKDVKRFLEWGYGRQFATMRSENDHLLSFVLDDKGELQYNRFGPMLTTPQYYYTSAGGINYVVDVRKPAGHRVTITSMANGEPFDLEKTYTVAMSSYQAAGGGGFMRSGLGWNEKEVQYHTLTQSSKDIRYYLAQYIKQNSPLTVSPRAHWKVVPEAWAEKAGKRDRELLMPYMNK